MSAANFGRFQVVSSAVTFCWLLPGNVPWLVRAGFSNLLKAFALSALSWLSLPIPWLGVSKPVAYNCPLIMQVPVHSGAAILPIGKSSRNAKGPWIGVISDTAWSCHPWHIRALDPGRAPGGGWDCSYFWGQGVQGMAVVPPVEGMLCLGGMLFWLASKKKWADHVPSRRMNGRLTRSSQSPYRSTYQSLTSVSGKDGQPSTEQWSETSKMSTTGNLASPTKNQQNLFSDRVSAMTEWA